MVKCGVVPTMNILVIKDVRHLFTVQSLGLVAGGNNAMCPNHPARSQCVPGAMSEDVNNWRKRQVLRQIVFQAGLG